MDMTIEDRIRRSLSTPLTSDDTIDPARELQDVLTSVGLDTGDSGGTVTFIGKDPIIRAHGLWRRWPAFR